MDADLTYRLLREATMKKKATFNPNVRTVGGILTHAVHFGLIGDVISILDDVARTQTNALPTKSRPHDAEARNTIRTAKAIVKHLTPEGVAALHRTNPIEALCEGARLLTTFHPEIIDGEQALRITSAERRVHPLLEKRGIEIYRVCHYYLFFDRTKDVVEWTVETFNEVSQKRLKSYYSVIEGDKSYYPSTQQLMEACIAYLDLPFKEDLKRSGGSSNYSRLAIDPVRLISAMGLLSTQALLDVMKRRWLMEVDEMSEDVRWKEPEQRLYQVSKYPFELIVDPSQRLTDKWSDADDCELWELFVYKLSWQRRRGPMREVAMLRRYSNEDEKLRELTVSETSIRARHFIRMGMKYGELAKLLETNLVGIGAARVDLNNPRLGAKIVDR